MAPLKPRPESPIMSCGAAMSEPVRNAGPVDAAGGFAGRSGGFLGGRKLPPPAAVAGATAGDVVVVAAIAVRARRLLRERVLTHTRAQLQLVDGEAPPSFAEAVDDESLGDFLGRLLSAQNQLASMRVATHGAAATRTLLDAALRDGATEAAELLAQDVASGGAGVAVVAAVLEEYARRLAALVADR
jgi:mRNA-degrading endonuclease toxin of MazEF toxin-antitoxin module